jgi:hypothetical protein
MYRPGPQPASNTSAPLSSLGLRPVEATNVDSEVCRTSLSNCVLRQRFHSKLKVEA